MMSKTKLFLPMLALLLCMDTFLFPVTAFAQSNEDTTPPTVTAQISGETLNITAKDDVGVAAVYIGGHRFSTLANGSASVYLKDYAGTGAKVEVYAVDTAGNRSQSVILDNPYYTAPQPTPAPPTSAPSSTPSSTAPPASSAPAPAISTPTPSSSDSGTSGATSASDPETESAIGTGDNVTTPGGIGTVTEVATDEDGKLFYTIETPAGNVFYLVIDMARTDGNNVYFLNAVTEDDLLALAETDGATTGGVSAIPAPEPDPEPTPEPEPMPDPEPEEPEEKSGSSTGALIFIVLAVIAIGGAGYYLKIVKPRKQAAMQSDYDEEADGEFDEDSEYPFEEDEGAYFYGDAEGGGKEPFDNE